MQSSNPGLPTPRDVQEWMERFGSVEIDAPAPVLASGAIRALREALARSGRDRKGAYALLAADGLLTSAVEACSEAEDPDAALRGILGLVAAEGGRSAE